LLTKAKKKEIALFWNTVLKRKRKKSGYFIKKKGRPVP